MAKHKHKHTFYSRMIRMLEKTKSKNDDNKKQQIKPTNLYILLDYANAKDVHGMTNYVGQKYPKHSLCVCVRALAIVF